MIDFLLEVIASVFGDVFSDWYERQSWWVKAIVISTFVFIVLMILYFLVFLPIFGSSRGSS
jgi:hypothetical protein